MVVDNTPTGEVRWLQLPHGRLLQQRWRVVRRVKQGPYGHYDVYLDGLETSYEWRDIPVVEEES